MSRTIEMSMPTPTLAGLTDEEIIRAVGDKLRGKVRLITFAELNRQYDAARKAFGAEPALALVSDQMMNQLSSLFPSQQRLMSAAVLDDKIYVGLKFQHATISTHPDAPDDQILWRAAK